MSYNKLPKDKLKSLLLFYPIFLVIIFGFSGDFNIKKLTVLVSVYILSASLNLMNINFLVDRFRLFRLIVVDIGSQFKKRLMFLTAGFLILLLLGDKANLLFQMIYIAVFISTDTYIGYLGKRYKQLMRKE